MVLKLCSEPPQHSINNLLLSPLLVLCFSHSIFLKEFDIISLWIHNMEASYPVAHLPAFPCVSGFPAATRGAWTCIAFSKLPRSPHSFPDHKLLEDWHYAMLVPQYLALSRHLVGAQYSFFSFFTREGEAEWMEAE